MVRLINILQHLLILAFTALLIVILYGIIEEARIAYQFELDNFLRSVYVSIFFIMALGASFKIGRKLMHDLVPMLEEDTDSRKKILARESTYFVAVVFSFAMILLFINIFVSVMTNFFY